MPYKLDGPFERSSRVLFVSFVKLEKTATYCLSRPEVSYLRLELRAVLFGKEVDPS